MLRQPVLSDGSADEVFGVEQVERERGRERLGVPDHLLALQSMQGLRDLIHPARRLSADGGWSD